MGKAASLLSSSPAPSDVPSDDDPPHQEPAKGAAEPAEIADDAPKADTTDARLVASPPVAEQSPTKTLATPLEMALVEEMRAIVRGNVTAVPQFVRDLVRYFDEGTRSGMTPSEVTQHLSGKASFVLGSLFCLPEVAGEAAARIGRDDEPAARIGRDDEPAADPLPPPPPPAPPPRWFDAMVGACCATPVWRFSVASVVVQFVPAHVDRRAVPALLGVLVCVRRAAPSLFEVALDALLVFLAADAHDKRYAPKALAKAVIGVTCALYA